MPKMSNKIVLDTHILIWSLIEPDRISSSIKEVITQAQNSDNLYIASITLWEIAMLVHKQRINVFKRTADFLNSITNLDGINLIDINAGIAAESVSLPGGFTGDPADCLIIASTRENAATMITKDQKILDWASQGYLKVIAA
jgi:PIN domain nuclease of toxin-antitoxin system